MRSQWSVATTCIMTPGTQAVGLPIGYAAFHDQKHKTTSLSDQWDRSHHWLDDKVESSC
jgi:hypothetical protein